MMSPRINTKGGYAGHIREIQAASTAGGGTALTSTAAVIPIKNGTDWLGLVTRNYSTAVVVKFALNPYLVILKTADNGATLTEYSNEAQDADASTLVTLSSLDTFANQDFLLVGSHLPFRGVSVTIGSTNGSANVLTVKYWNGSAWTDISASDGTTSGGASFAQTGNVTWTVPAATAWIAATLGVTTTPSIATTNRYVKSDAMFWTRWEWSAAMDSSTTATAMLALNRSTAYGELVSGQTFEELVYKGPYGIAGVEALTDAGTANLIVNCGVTDEGGSGIGLI